MSDDSACAAGGAPLDLGPLELWVGDRQWCFRLSAPDEMTLELPPDYENVLRKRLGPMLEGKPEPVLVMDLENLPAISSRHLGLMIAIHKALGDRCGKLRLRNVSGAVRRLLDLTRTSRFFEME